MNRQLKNTFIYLTFILSCFPILSFGTRSVLTIFWSILGVYVFFLQKKKLNLSLDVLIFILPYVLISFSILYSTNKEYGIGELLKMLSFFIFPIIFYLNRSFFSKKQVYKMLYFFSFSILILIFFQVIHVLINFDFISSALTPLEIKSNGYFSINEITEDKIDQIKLRRFRNFIIAITNSHTTYQGLWISFSVFFLGFQFKKTKKKSVKFINLLLITILMSWLFFISARMPLLALVISSLLSVTFFSNFSRIYLISLGVVFSLFLIISISFKNPFSVRVKEYYNTGLTLLKKGSKKSEFNSSNVRNGIYYCDLDLISKSPFFGVGIGDIQDKLNECYNEKVSSDIYTWRDYNSHNQYLFFWISSGVFGFVLFVFLLFYCLIKSLKYSEIIYFYFLSLVALIFFTENLLSRSDGVLFFSFFNALFFFNILKKRIV
jgi:O-antigen ligase